MNIVLATEVIHPGGAETFILRLANALHARGNKVFVFVFYEHLLNYNLCKLLAPDVTIIPAKIPMASLLGKADGLLFRLGIDRSIRNYFIRKTLRGLVTREKIDVIHSHLLKADRLALDVATNHNIPVVDTIHGDYLQFFEKTQKGIKIPLLNYIDKAKKNLTQIARIACISDKQINFFNEHFASETSGKIIKIYNGYDGTIKQDRDSVKKQLGIKEGDFVFGMVSRGIAEKGWQTAIDAFLETGNTNAHLVLVGNSEYLNGLSTKYNTNKNIHFTGHADNPINYINIFDVGLLPTTYPSESLPTVIIEYLFCHAPVIASNAGEITNMTGQNNAPAGQIIAIKDGIVPVKEVAEAMSSYMNNSSLYTEHKNNTAVCYEQFDMDKCVNGYMDVYKDAVAQYKNIRN